MLEWLAIQILVNFESFIMKLKFSFVDERKFEPHRRLGPFGFQGKKIPFRLPLSPPPPPLPAQCWVLHDKHPLHILHTFIRTSILFGVGGGGPC